MAEQKQRPIGDPMTTGPISGGGPGGRGGGGQYSLPNTKVRLNQLIYDRRLSQKAGFDTKAETYAPNAEIDRLRKQLRGK